VTKPLIGQFLVSEGMLSNEAIARALSFQKSGAESLRLGTILLNWDLLAEDALLAALSRYHGCPFADWPTLSKASPEALRCLPAQQAVRLGAIPYAFEAGGLRVAFRNPSDLAVIDRASQISGRRVLPATTTEVRLALALHQFYGHPLPFQFKPVIQKLERRKTSPSVKALVAAVPAGNSEVPPPRFENIPSPFDASAAATEMAEPAAAYSGAVVAPIEIPEFPLLPGGGPPASPRAPRSRDEILGPVLEILLLYFPRVILLGAGKSALTGWTGRGPGLTNESIAAIRIPRTDQNVLIDVANSGVPHLGPVDCERYPQALRAVLGRETCDCAVFPVSVLGAVAGLLYADRLGEPMPSEDVLGLAHGAASAASLLSGFLLERPDEE
jgi:Type II secretion system (T2SS), protein E, N-terminal domain